MERVSSVTAFSGHGRPGHNREYWKRVGRHAVVRGVSSGEPGRLAAAGDHLGAPISYLGADQVFVTQSRETKGQNSPGVPAEWPKWGFKFKDWLIYR